jgi:hypothetical protein
MYRKSLYTRRQSRNNLLPLVSSNTFLHGESVFQIIDHLHPTATSLDQLPAWFIRIGAPLFYEPITMLFNLSLAFPAFPLFRYSGIKPLCGLLQSIYPSQPTDFKPISIIPDLTCIMH